MFDKKAASGATVAVNLIGYTGTTASGASARSIIGYWPRETVYAIDPTSRAISEYDGTPGSWTPIGGASSPVVVSED